MKPLQLEISKGACRATAFALLALLMLPPIGPTRAADGDAATLTGVSTPQSEALDTEAEKLVADRAKLIAEYKERNRKRQAVGDLLQRANKLVLDAYKKGEEAADLRAAAAMEQRCVKPSTEGGAGSTARLASPYVCPSVLGNPTSGGNDLWTVCACARRYLLGAQQEIEKLQSGSDQYIGKLAATSMEVSKYPLTASDLNNLFRKDQTIDVDGPFRENIDSIIRKVQRQLARDRIEGLLYDRPAVVRSEVELFGSDKFQSARHAAYSAVQNALALLWQIHRADTLLQTRILQQSVNERFEQEFIAAQAEAKGYWEQNRDNPDAAERQIVAMSKRIDHQQYPLIEDAAARLRGIAAVTKDTRARLLRDAQAWKAFAANDGGVGITAGYGNEDFARYIVDQFMGDWSLAIGIWSWRGNWASTQYANNRQWTHLFPGQSPGDNFEGISAAFRQRLPEASVVASGSLMLRQQINSKGRETVQATASGAGAAQSP